ncbi:MAG TPA: phytanoyl-CoA dioxygenase family protein [Phenylobacterium sp.]
MMAKPTAGPGLAADVISDFIETGAHLFHAPVDAAAAGELLAEVRATRAFDASLFLSEAEFDADPQYTGVNPKPGRNLLERFEARLGFVEQAPHIVAAVSALLGDDYEILNKKVVCGVPARSIPGWLKTRIHGNPVNNLGAYVKPQNRDITYFYGIDFHQDLIDYKEREADFLTLYIYLHPVTAADAPLYLLEGSHRLGGSVFPHDLTRTAPDTWLYGNGEHGKTETQQRILTGGAGFAAMWHACTLHGTQPDAADHERISLRYLIARGQGPAPGMDAVNATLQGPLSLADTRKDLAADGSAQMRANTVLKA